MAFAQQAVAAVPQSVSALLAQDRRLALVSERMLAANAPLCRQAMPLTGMVVHSRDQYGNAAEGMFANGPVEVALVLPGSPAERAGLTAGDGLALIGANPTSALRADGESPMRDAAFATLAEAWPGSGPLALTVARDGQLRQTELTPQRGCRALVEIRTRDSLGARSDGRVIQVDLALAKAASDEELAVIFAHELAHLVLEHRRRLEAAGVKKGLLGQFGRHRRLNRQVEEEADRLSAHLLARAGYDPHIAPTFWRSDLARRAAGGLLRSAAYSSPGDRAQLLEREIADYLSQDGVSDAAHLLALRDIPFKR